MLRNKYGKICKKEKKSSTNSVNSKSPLLTYFFFLFREVMASLSGNSDSKPKYTL